MDNSIVVDANVLVYGCTGDGDCALRCANIFFKIDEGEVQLGIDTKGVILEAYKEKLNRYRATPIAKMIQRFIWTEIYRTTGKRKIKFCIPIHEKKVEELLEMGFHDKDIMYVRIAPSTGLRTIFSTDTRSFLDPTYSLWLQENLKVDTKHPSDFFDCICRISRP